MGFFKGLFPTLIFALITNSEVFAAGGKEINLLKLFKEFKLIEKKINRKIEENGEDIKTIEIRIRDKDYILMPSSVLSLSDGFVSNSWLGNDFDFSGKNIAIIITTLRCDFVNQSENIGSKGANEIYKLNFSYLMTDNHIYKRYINTCQATLEKLGRSDAMTQTALILMGKISDNPIGSGDNKLLEIDEIMFYFQLRKFWGIGLDVFLSNFWLEFGLGVIELSEEDFR